MTRNETRAARAAAALAAYQLVILGENRPIQEADITDFLTDLRHYLSQENINWAVVTKRASEHYRAEVSEDLPAANPREPFLIRGPGKDFKITKCD